MDLIMIARLTLKWPNACVSAMLLLNNQREYRILYYLQTRNHETDKSFVWRGDMTNSSRPLLFFHSTAKAT